MLLPTPNWLPHPRRQKSENGLPEPGTWGNCQEGRWKPEECAQGGRLQRNFTKKIPLVIKVCILSTNMYWPLTMWQTLLRSGDIKGIRYLPCSQEVCLVEELDIETEADNVEWQRLWFSWVLKDELIFQEKSRKEKYSRQKEQEQRIGRILPLGAPPVLWYGRGKCSRVRAGVRKLSRTRQVI